MSQFVVNLNEPEKPTPPPAGAAFPGGEQPAAKKRGCRRALGILGLLAVLMVLAGGIAGYFYWQNLKTTPQYSLALLVDAARRNDQQTIDQLVDTDAVVESFMPQITDKAIELYGKNLPPATIDRVARAAAPFIPAVKQRAREEVPRVIREKTDKFANVPFWSIAVGAGQFLDIRREGDLSYVKSRVPEREIELTMRRNGDQWQVVAIKDDALARRVAERIGQELITIASRGGLKKAGEKMTVPNLETLKKLEEIFR